MLSNFYFTMEAEDLIFFFFFTLKIIVFYIYIFFMYHLASTPIDQINYNAGIYFTTFYF